ncbi:adhesion G-protein coupled receptor F1 [Gadus chalcogrammus]|uniref:adhesion G-protein coupled receptor F1 n=1 Tax=Gadus chalcogrammus TaxID=1042646 RepID=UPI0024C4A944|nr:adhesion G-protein coupled receptor F1 [Gadus chalcogrammus]XP_056437290.1 adhesion G-protein coupled receptor F1 [Gadus chalcogrammus]
MLCRVLIILGTVFIYNQVVSGDVFVAELMVESNITLATSSILSTFNNSQLNVATQQVSIQEIELVSDCLLLGETVRCDCGQGYIWTNDVCYNTTCCNDSTCTKPILGYEPMCIPKFPVQIVGTVELVTGPWDDAAEAMLIAGLKKLNGFESLNVTTLQSDAIADFVANVSAVFLTSKLQEVLGSLELQMNASIVMESIGLVEMTATGSLVCYDSTPMMTCTFNEILGVNMWSMSRGEEFAELGNGSVAQLTTCEIANTPACIHLTLNRVNGNWAGVFKCEFSEGSVRHTALLGLNVALLPDPIKMVMDPLTVDCSEGESDSETVKVTTTIAPTTEDYKVTWFYRGVEQATLTPTVSVEEQVYTFDVPISCIKSLDPHYVNITFENKKDQKKTLRLDIGVIYPGAPFCAREYSGLSWWPRTPAGNSVFIRTCPEGREGYVSRTCDGSVWQEPYFQCISTDVLRALEVADSFKQGFGATQSAAEGIFGNLNNGSSKNTGSKEDLADLGAGISILSTMAQASGNVVLHDQLFPDLINAASNMLNQSWKAVNITVQNTMSTQYLESVEGLVENIQANLSKGEDSDNVKLVICQVEEEDCSQTVFGVDVAVNNSEGIIKTMAVKNLAYKLPRINKNSKTASLVVSATLQNSSTETIDIRLNFPREYPDYNKVECVFWNISSHQWSGEGCQLVTSEDGNETICECSHLTPFSALMSKTTLILPMLDELTYLGLGVSICSLLLFLIIEALVWSAVVKSNLSHFRHTSLVNIAVSLLLADLCFLASSFPDKISENTCLVFTICQHLFFLTMFCWMLCLSVMLVHQLIFVFNPLRKRVFMFLSSIVGYIVPMLIVGSTYVYYKYTGGDYRKKGTCWLGYDGLLRGSIHAFLLPVGVVILTNLFSMCVVILTLTKTAVPDDNKSDADTAKSILKVMLFLTPAFGLTWILGFVMLFLGDSSDEASIEGSTQSGLMIFITYAFTILNSFQGLFLFITGVLAEQRVRDEVLKLILAKTSSGEKSNNTTNTSKN